MTKKILIVDDEPDLLKVTVTRLEVSGYEVFQAVSSEDAIEVLKENRPDLILLDLLLPNMQGDVLCKELKADKDLRTIPIVLFTASIIRVPEKVKEMGADDYIMKPFEPEDLLFKIKKFIG